MNEKISSDFIKPPSEFRGAPFWAWNGKLDKDELRSQIQIMNKMGLGGFFMHSRTGLDTPYLSDEWFDCINTCIEEAEKLNMMAWLYDEDRWPSGAAGGLVTRNIEYRARKLFIEEINDLSDYDSSINPIALYLAKINGDNITNLRRIKKMPVKLKGADTLLCFYVELDKCEPWYNGGTYLDTLNEKAVQEFIKITHEAYRERFSDYFGGVVPGIFTDEPNYSHVFMTQGNITTCPWTDSLTLFFEKHYGYDILEHLPELVYNVEGTGCKTRYNYLDCITRMFVNTFGRQIGNWCNQNNMLYTGHLLHEDTLRDQTFVVGSCMRFYEYMQTPGMDILTEHWRIYDAAKQVSSVAHQFGRQWRLTETYGGTGWDFSFLGHKAIGDWQLALGINLRCQHLSWYTMQGQAKRDYPASILYQSPWWEQYNKVENYFARINLTMNKGEEIRDLLFLHPIESAWTVFSRNRKENKKLLTLDNNFVKMRDCLLQAHLDFDFGDEDIMARHAKVEIQNNIPVLKVAQAAYRAVVIPEMFTVRSSTLAILQEFTDKGGQVVFGAPPAKMLDAISSGAVEDFARGCTCFKEPCEELVKELEANCRRISITHPSSKEIGEVLYLLREDDDSAYLFICNTGTTNIAPKSNPSIHELTKEFTEVLIELKTSINGKIIELSAETGEISQIESSHKNNSYFIKTSLPALGSRLFAVVPASVAEGMGPSARYIDETTKQFEERNFKVTLNEDNVLPLDRAEYRIAKGEYKKSEYILFIDQAVRDALGIEYRSGRMNQPWTRQNKTIHKKLDVELKYTFNVEYQPSGDLKLGLESPELYDMILINGNVVRNNPNGWWCDKSLKTILINPKFIIPGENEIILRCSYSIENSGLECIYILGDFGTRADDLDLSIIKPVTKLAIGDWVKQGLTFYSGSVSYHAKLNIKPESDRRYIIRISEFRASCIRIIINGEDAGNIAWPPWELDITDFLSTGKNQIIIELYGSRRNSHGPLYMNQTWPNGTGPVHFLEYTGKYKLVPYGLMAIPELLIKRKV